MLRITHDGVQPGPAVAEPVRFGVQDSKGEVHPGRITDAGAYCFDIAVDVKGERDGAPVMSGPFCHGPPKARFIYLSWKREGVHAAPWAWRIKIPLSGIDPAAIRDAGSCGWIEADATGRRPHMTVPIRWRVREG